MIKNTSTCNLYLESIEEIHQASLSFCETQFLDQQPLDFLHPQELQYFKTLLYERRINSYLLGRYAAKNAISPLISESHLNHILIEKGLFNQPICKSHAHIHVSIAHSHEHAVAIAFHNTLIMGIDIEKVQPLFGSSIEIELTHDEKKLIRQLSLSFDYSYILFWTIKESLSKALKTGLTVPLHILEINHAEIKGHYYYSTFTHFSQYHTFSWIRGDYICSITHPKNTKISQDIYRW